MKKLLGCLGIVFVLLVAGFIGLMVLGYYVSGNRQAAFFEKLNAGDTAGLEEMMSPTLRTQVDPAVLKAVVDEVREQLGTYEGPAAAGFEVERMRAGDQPLTVVSGTAKFSQGETPVELIYVEDDLLGFDIQSEEIVNGAFQRPELEDEFKARGQRFFELALGGRLEEAHQMLHPEVQAQVPMEKLEAVVGEALSMYGPLQSLSFSVLKNEAVANGHLKIYYDIVYEKGATTAQVDFVFTGMQAAIEGFYLAM